MIVERSSWVSDWQAWPRTPVLINNHWQTNTRQNCTGCAVSQSGFGTYVDTPADHMIPSLSPVLVCSCTLPPFTTHYRCNPPPPPRVIALCLAMVKLENNWLIALEIWRLIEPKICNKSDHYSVLTTFKCWWLFSVTTLTTVNPVFKAATLITVPIRKWLDKNAKVRGATFITRFGRSDQKHGPTAASKPVQFATRGLSSLPSGRQ